VLRSILGPASPAGDKPNGTTLTVEEWTELVNRHDRLDQYAKKRREKSDDEKG
jgi:hypothetical protein